MSVDSDGGGLVRAALRPIVGADQRRAVPARRAAQGTELAVVERDVNGELGLVVSVGDQVVGTVSLGTVSLDTGDGRIHDVWIVMNPDKLSAWNR